MTMDSLRANKKGTTACWKGAAGGAHQLGEGQDEGRERGDVGLQRERRGGHHVALQHDATDAVLRAAAAGTRPSGSAAWAVSLCCANWLLYPNSSGRLDRLANRSVPPLDPNSALSNVGPKLTIPTRNSNLKIYTR